jgi:hypothetical protein
MVFPRRNTMKRLFGMVILSALFVMVAAYAIEYPQFKSAVSTTGITVNFDTLYSKADQLNMVHDIVEHDSSQIIWKYKDTGNWAVLNDDGTVVVASPSVFSLDIKKVLDDDLVRASNLVQLAGGSISYAPRIYYVENPYLYRIIKYDFNDDFDLELSIPNCTLQKAMLSVTGSDYSKLDTVRNEVLVPGQHYWIDDMEVSGCDAVSCQGLTGATPGSGISCMPGPCKKSGLTHVEIQVSVRPVDITGKITPGIHRISARGIGDQHTMIVEAVTSPSTDEMLLYNDPYTVMINETRSSPMIELYALIQPNIAAFNTTNTTLVTNASM